MSTESADLISARKSQSLIVLSLAEATMRPSGENAVEVICPDPPRVRSSLPLAKFQSLTAPSRPPEARMLPSGENATEVTAAECPRSVGSSRPVATSQSEIFPPPARGKVFASSPLPAASTRPSGENATAVT